jgi:hypothetical protein
MGGGLRSAKRFCIMGDQIQQQNKNKIYTNKEELTLAGPGIAMGVRRLFSRGGPKIYRGVGKNLLFAQKPKKRYNLKKSLKTYYFWQALAGQGGGQEPPLPSLPDVHGYCFYGTQICRVLISRMTHLP